MYTSIQDLTDIGYNQVRGVLPTKISRSKEIERIRNARNSGDRVPPPFPNGWYMVTESYFLKRGQVLSVDIIGKDETKMSEF